MKGNRTPTVLVASALDKVPDHGSKGHMALRDSSFQTYTFVDVADKRWSAGADIDTLTCAVGGQIVSFTWS